MDSSLWSNADESPIVLPDSDDEDSFLSNKKSGRERIIDDTDSEDDTEKESTKGDSGQHSIDESSEDADERDELSDDEDDQLSSADLSVGIDDERMRLVKSNPRKTNASRKILDESEEILTSQSEEESNGESASDTDLSKARSKSLKSNATHVEDLETNEVDANSDVEFHIDTIDKTVGTSKAQKKVEDDSKDSDTSLLTISDDSGADDDAHPSNPDRNADHVSGKSVTRTLTPDLDSEDEAAVMPFVRKEVGVGNVNPVIEQKKALLVYNIEKIETQLTKSKMLLNTANIDLLPDKGERLKLSISMQEMELKNLTTKLDSYPKLGTPKSKAKTFDETNPAAQSPWKNHTSEAALKPLGKKALETQQREQALTEDRIKDLHGSLNARPSEDERAEDPNGLKVSLMPHQQHALAWLLWREQQRPHGGILADDMGLGKTLTMISLILSTLHSRHDDDSDDDEDEWFHRKKSVRTKGGSLVVCPASVLNQWNAEIERRVKHGKLKVGLFHGNNRESVARRLAQNDVVITTYNLIGREYKSASDSILYTITWERIILDEAHVVRNHKSRSSEAVCNLFARSRWALTGTPIQNKELDLYALLKFLKCTPFDNLHVWKRWVDNKNAHGHERLTTVMKTLMLRRTKLDLQAKGDLASLPDKNLEEIHVKLDPEEQLVYEKVLVFSRTLFGQFLHQRAEKNHMFELNSGKFDAPTFCQMPKDTQFTKAQNQLLARHADVKVHDILVLLLRLRQICCQPSLIHAMLDNEDVEDNDLVDEEGSAFDLMTGVGALNLEDNENIDPTDIGVDRRVTQNLLTTKNPVFNTDRISSKLRAVLATIETILEKGDKLIVVSQWTSMLEIVRSQLDSMPGATYAILSGSVAVKHRQQLMDSFNRVDEAPQILLLSLTAGGVGLNLVGGNHLLLLDIHWNPQLEAQAQDRIYRVGQKKSVYIYKFICLDTVEQRIKALQDRKLALADGVLTGAGTAGAAKLTLDDMKSLFSI